MLSKDDPWGTSQNYLNTPKITNAWFSTLTNDWIMLSDQSIGEMAIFHHFLSPWPLQCDMATFPIKQWGLCLHSLIGLVTHFGQQNEVEVFSNWFWAQDSRRVFWNTATTLQLREGESAIEQEIMWRRAQLSLWGHSRPACSKPAPSHISKSSQDLQSCLSDPPGDRCVSSEEISGFK